MLLHASCAARDGEAVLLLGPPGSGKSDLLLRLLDSGWRLVGDDQVEVTAAAGHLCASAPAALAGGMEVRGLGLLRDLPAVADAPLRLAVQLVPLCAVPRLPEPASFTCEGHDLPMIALHAFEASAPAKVAWALTAAQGRSRLAAGAFAA